MARIKKIKIAADFRKISFLFKCSYFSVTNQKIQLEKSLIYNFRIVCVVVVLWWTMIG